jgi:uncharacterized protein YaaQ
MRLVLAIVQQEDAEFVGDALIRQGHPVTRIRTAGGFLRQGNETLLIGVEVDGLPRVLEVIRAHCRVRTELLVPEAPDEFAAPWMAGPITVTVGGATVFILDIECYARVMGRACSDAAPQASPPGMWRGGSMEAGTKLIIAIVHADDADRAIRALLEQQIRVTRINTVGGFLKRGHVTLLIGVDAALVDRVMQTLSRAVGRASAELEAVRPERDGRLARIESELRARRADRTVIDQARARRAKVESDKRLQAAIQQAKENVERVRADDAGVRQAQEEVDRLLALIARPPEPLRSVFPAEEALAAEGERAEPEAGEGEGAQGNRATVAEDR